MSCSLILLLSSWGRWIYLEEGSDHSVVDLYQQYTTVLVLEPVQLFVILCHMKSLIRNYYIFQRDNVGCQNSPSQKSDAEMCGKWSWPIFCQTNLPQRSLSVPSASSCFSDWRSTKCLCPSALRAIQQGLPNTQRVLATFWQATIQWKKKNRFEMVLGAIPMQFFMIHTHSESAP